MNKIKLSNTLSYTMKEIKRRISVLNDTLKEKKKELSKLTEDKVYIDIILILFFFL